jgi:hypothetical protein
MYPVYGSYHLQMECCAVSILIETDGRSRAVIPGHKNERFLLQETRTAASCCTPPVL